MSWILSFFSIFVHHQQQSRGTHSDGRGIALRNRAYMGYQLVVTKIGYGNELA
jgi:hypothetical protein